jgi:predicted RNase H-like HicB family nuclease
MGATVRFSHPFSIKDGRMLREYIDAAMHAATYEILDTDGTFFGEIPGFEGVYANATTLEACRDELEEVLEEWVLFRISRALALPAVNGVELKIRKVG